MALRDILITPEPVWLVGEGEEKPEYLLDKDGLRTIPIPAGPDDHYPDDYAGKVVAVRPAGWRWTEMDKAGGRKIVTMDLTDQEAGWVSSRTRKIINGKRELITFEDRWGSQVAARLRERFDDVEDAELRSTDPYDYIGRQFAAQSVLFKKLLTPTVVHTGAGLYEVGPAKTYSTWGSALAQLFTDQGSAEFTAIQYIRGFADTYDETVSPSTSLNPSEASGYPLVLEGDPTDSRNNIHVAPSSGRGVWGRPDFVLVRHLKITTTNSNAIQSSVTDLLLVHDCIITAPATAMGVQSFAVGVNVEDCVIVAGTYGIEATSSTRSLSVRRCAISGNGAAGASYGVAAIAGADCPVVVDGCTIANFASAGSAAIYTDDVSAPIIASNNTFFNCTSGLRVIRSQGVTSINNIFDSCTYNYYSNIWPDEAVEGSITETWALRNNCYKAGYTGFAYNGAASKTHAEFVAFDLVDEDGDLVDTDPLLTNPGAGDFSLGVGSPCINAGHGSGVITGSNGVAYDPNNPDIGGWSSGALPAPAAPTWAANTSNIAATDLGSDGDVGLAWDAATPDASGDVGYIIEARTAAGPGAWVELFRTIQVVEIAAGLTNTTPYDFRVKAYTRVAGEPTQTPADTDSATPTAAGVPVAPQVTATDLLNQSDVKVDIAADNPADVSTIYYQIVPGGALLTWGNTVTGDGSETLTGLLVQPYVIYAVAERGGCNSVASNLVFLTVQAADQYTNIRQALEDWVQGVAGNTKVIWRDGNAPQPSRQFVTIHMGPTVGVGSDWHGNNDANGVEDIKGNREFVFNVQVQGKPSNEDGSTSISIMERISSSLEKRSIQATLSAAGLVRRTVEGSGDLSSIGGTQWEARAFKDFRFGITHSDTDDVGLIGSVIDPVGTYDE